MVRNRTILLVCLALGCGEAAPTVSEWRAVTGATCNARTRTFPRLASPHVLADAGPIQWNSDPPSSGPHDAVWARWGAHASPVPRPNYLHNEEHGGVVLAYRCDDDRCPLAAELRTVLDALPPDPACDMPALPRRPRVVLTPDPLLTAPVAMAAWGEVYQADCVDAASVRAFYSAHVAHGPEDTCAEGSVP